MRISSAVLRAVGATRPYTESMPLAVEELELSGPGRGELLVRIEAAGVCHSDLSVVTGQRPRPLPMALGHEAAGVVLEVGDDVHDVVPGDHVVLVFVPSCGSCDHCRAGRPALCTVGGAASARGELLSGGSRLRAIGDGDLEGTELVNHHLGVSAFAEHAVVDRASAVVIDADVPFDVAAVLGCALLTGFGAVQNTAGVRAGETVTVIGLGGVGQAAVLGAVAADASMVLAVDPVEHKRQLALELGASHACAPADAAALLETLGGGTRWVFEAVGAAAVLEQAFSLTGRGGTTVSIGLPPPQAMIALPALAFAGEGKTITGSYMGSAVPRRDIPAMVRRWRSGALPVEKLVTGVLPLGSINAAFEQLADGQAVRQLIHPHG